MILHGHGASQQRTLAAREAMPIHLAGSDGEVVVTDESSSDASARATSVEDSNASSPLGLALSSTSEHEDEDAVEEFSPMSSFGGHHQNKFFFKIELLKQTPRSPWAASALSSSPPS